jgi:hypothetical protein
LYIEESQVTSWTHTHERKAGKAKEKFV